jgi:hypothetical protein
MSLTFATYKQIIPQQILSRGREYFSRGQITDLSFDEAEMVWEAQVEGTELYEVRVELTDTGNLVCSCDCPYDMGEHCKHIAAVLYAIEDSFPDQLGVSPRRKSAKRQTRYDKLRERLEKATREQLVTTLLKLAQDDRELLNQLLVHLDTGQAKPADFKRLVKDALRSGKRDYGFLDYTGSIRAGRKLQELASQAQGWESSGEVEKAVSMYQALIEVTVPAMSQADDSNGDLGGGISLAIQGLESSIQHLTESGREAVFIFCLEQCRLKEFLDWDWGWDLLRTASALVDSPARRALFNSALDDIEGALGKPDDYSHYRSFQYARVAQQRLAMIDRYDGKAAADAFLRNHVHLDDMRKVLIERCLADNALDEAMRLIDEGTQSSERRRLPGLTHQYRALRIKLLQHTGDKSGLLDAARQQWLEGGPREEFELLTQLVEKDKWTAFIEGLIADLRDKPQQLAWLYAHENRWRDLMNLINSSRQGDWLLDAHRKELEARYPAEVAVLYERAVDAVMLHASDRNQYRQAAAYLQRMKQIGQQERAQSVIARLKAKFANRPALLDELKQVE